MTGFVLLDTGSPAEVEARIVEDAVWIGLEGINETLGWELKPEGLCRDDVCIPVTENLGLVHDGAIHLEKLATLLGRPLAVSLDERAGYLGSPLSAYDETVMMLEAPDFTLPDLEGNLHSLSDHRGSKVLLAAWASW